MLIQCALPEIGTSSYLYHCERRGVVHAEMDKLFAHLDDHTRLSSHMSKPSWMMAGSSMKIELDADHGQRVGSRIRLSGRIFGFTLSVDEIVKERIPPRRKVWETIGPPKLLVIGHYRMGFEISQHECESWLSVFIDYELPPGALTRWLGYIFGRYYARWCVTRMVADAVRQFASNRGEQESNEHMHQQENL